jgi:hypothetical protein
MEEIKYLQQGWKKGGNNADVDASPPTNKTIPTTLYNPSKGIPRRRSIIMGTVTAIA